MENRISMAEFAEREGIALTIIGDPQYVTENQDGQLWQHYAYKLRLTRKDENGRRKSLTVAWKQGLGLKDAPSVAEVLYNVAGDARFGRDDFEEFCANLGYDSDSREAEKTWRACQSQERKLARFLGDALASELIEDVEE